MQLKVKKIRTDNGHCLDYFKVIEGKHKGLTLCKYNCPPDDVEGFMSCSSDGEPDSPIKKDIEVIIV